MVYPFEVYTQQVREQNLYHEGDSLPAGQMITDFHLRRCWNDLMVKINYEDRVAAIEKFNKFVANPKDSFVHTV